MDNGHEGRWRHGHAAHQAKLDFQSRLFVFRERLANVFESMVDVSDKFWLFRSINYFGAHLLSENNLGNSLAHGKILVANGLDLILKVKVNISAREIYTEYRKDVRKLF